MVLNENHFLAFFCGKDGSVECSAVIKELKIRPIRRLNHKENSTVFTASREDGTVFVLRVYDRETAAYKMLEGKDIPGLPRVYGCRFVHGFFVVEEEYIDGISMQEMIDGGEKMSEARARDIVSSICGTGAVRTAKVRCTNRYLCGWHFAEHLAYGCASSGGAVPQRRPEDKASRIYKIIAAACFVPLFLLGFIIFDSIYYPTVETEDFSMSDSACLVCTKEGNIYILYRNNAKRLELPVLDFYREKTGEKAKVQVTQNGTVKMGSIEYNI